MWVPAALCLAAAQLACGSDEGAPVVDALGTDGGEEATVDSSDAADDRWEASATDASAEGSIDASSDAPTEAASDAVAISDAPSEAGDAQSEASVDAGPPFCGDGLVEVGQEECDDGVVSILPDSCSSLCEVRDVLAYRTASDAGAKQRVLGTGRHPIAGSTSGFAVSWINTTVPSLGATFYDVKGIPTGTVFSFAGPAPLTAGPVLAALPGGKYAVAWTDLGGDGDGEGVALRLLDPNVAPSGLPAHANQTSSFSQFGADAVWTGTELVVAWSDTSNGQTGPDVRYRTFDAQLQPTSAELTLAATSAFETDVALAPFASGWAAAWSESQNGQEVVRARVANVTFAVGPFAPNPYGDPPALAELDATHALLVFVQGGTTAMLRGAILDTSQPGTATAFDIAPLTQGSTPPGVLRPNALRAGARVFVAWASQPVLADPRAEETWLKEVSWNGTSLGMASPEVPLPRWDGHRLGDQRFPALASLGTSVAAAWLDLGATFQGGANGDIAIELMPMPLLRKLGADGGGL